MLRENTLRDMAVSWWKTTISILISILFVYSLVMFTEWAFTVQHEKAHIAGCEIANISCNLNYKSYMSYIFSATTNIFKGEFFTAEMNITPNNATSFCSTSFAEKQIILLAGFRSDVSILKRLFYIFVTELVVYLILAHRKKLSPNANSWFLILLILTSAILFAHLLSFEGYLTKNVGDLFYNPCY